MTCLDIIWKGVTPLIMHSNQCVSPVNPYSIEMKKYTSKRNKTEEDYLMMSNIEWKGSAYYRDDIGMYIPAENIEATIINGAKSFRKGTDIQKFCSVRDPYIPLDYGQKLTIDELLADYNFRDVRIMTVQRSKVVRTRPRFNRWAINFVYVYDEKRIDLETIKNAIEYAGAYVGLCDSRPRYGKFVAVIEEMD